MCVTYKHTWERYSKGAGASNKTAIAADSFCKTPRFLDCLLFVISSLAPGSAWPEGRPREDGDAGLSRHQRDAGTAGTRRATRQGWSRRLQRNRCKYFGQYSYIRRDSVMAASQNNVCTWLFLSQLFHFEEDRNMIFHVFAVFETLRV